MICETKKFAICRLIYLNDFPQPVWKFPGVLQLDPQVNYVHPLWTYFDPGWTYLGHSKFDHIWDIGLSNHVKKSIFLVQT